MLWHSHYQPDPITGRERNRFAIEVGPPVVFLSNALNVSNQDPFETDFNVARCVTKEGLFMVSRNLSIWLRR